MSVFDYDAIYTYADGTPIEGNPGPVPQDADIETKIAWMRARSAFRDKVTDVANRAFDQEFRKALKAST